MPQKLLFVFGTRPEAIKLAPVILETRRDPDAFRTVVCVTAQHRDMLDQVLDIFGIRPDHDLDLMKEGQTLFQITTAALCGLERTLEEEKPDLALVHGDTTTALAASLASYYKRVPVAHVEAGLRTGDRYSPFPEEMNRVLADRIAELHFAPTEAARRNLLREGIPKEGVFVTGNTVIDALRLCERRLDGDRELSGRMTAKFPFLKEKKRRILVTAHRRESFGKGLADIFGGLLDLATAYPDAQIVYPVHRNPNVRRAAGEILASSKRANIFLLEPLDYLECVHLMRESYLIITDSGGLQEEGPALGRPVLVTRDVTERPEAVEAGTVRVVGTDRAKILRECSRLLDDPRAYAKMSRAVNPYGDGLASKRIAAVLKKDRGL